MHTETELNNCLTRPCRGPLLLGGRNYAQMMVPARNPRPSSPSGSDFPSHLSTCHFGQAVCKFVLFWQVIYGPIASQLTGGFLGGIVLASDRENYFWPAGQNVRQAFSVLPDIWSPCRTFLPAGDRQIFSLYWTLPDKMSGSVWALCRTSPELCRTCPACPAYFAITVLVTFT